MAAVTSRYFYITRNREDIIDKATKGEFLSLSLQVQDSPTRPRKFPSYVITHYQVDVDPNLDQELPGVYSARRFRPKGVPINRIVVTWDLLYPPPSMFAFSFLLCLPACEIRRISDNQPI